MTSVDRLWAPWRHTFITGRRPRGCIFCAAKRSTADRAHHVIERGEHAFAMLNLYPYNNGHLMIAPYRHIGTLAQIRPAEWSELLRLAQRLTARLTRLLHPHGYNLGLNLGRDAGAGIPGHLHLHVVPRWRGDTNYMPILTNVKVISQSLEELFTALASPRRGRAR